MHFYIAEPFHIDTVKPPQIAQGKDSLRGFTFTHLPEFLWHFPA